MGGSATFEHVMTHVYWMDHSFLVIKNVAKYYKKPKKFLHDHKRILSI